MQFPPWNATHTEAIWVMVLFTIGYCLYFFVSESSRLRLYFQQQYGHDYHFVQGSRYFGGMVIGLLPALLMGLLMGKSLSDYGVKADDGFLSWYWILGIACIVVPMNFFNSRKAKHLAMYPTVRRREWTRGQVASYAFSWVFYLFGYELMFRGLLLWSLLPIMGAWPAIILNVVLYVLVHVPKSLEETIGAAPLGLLLCLITLTTGTIWVAFVVHVILALSNFLYSLRHHPDMRLIR
ncbi:MAG: CPBP family glutamic-type intramembrane protease [Saprospiraceae bacterium]